MSDQYFQRVAYRIALNLGATRPVAQGRSERSPGDHPLLVAIDRRFPPTKEAEYRSAQ